MSNSDLPVRTSLWQWLQVGLLIANLWWTTLCLGGYRPETMVVTSVLTGLLLVVHFGGIASGMNDGGESPPAVPTAHPAGWWLLPFLIYAAVSAARIAPAPWLGWHDWLTWAQMVAVFWVALNGVRSSRPWAVLFASLFGLGAVAAGMAVYQRFVQPDWLMLGRTQAAQFFGRSSGPFGIPNSLGAFLLLLLPPAGILACQREAGIGRRVLFGGLTLVLATGLVLTISRGAWLGLGLALAAWPMFSRNRHWIWRLGVATAVLGILIAVGFALYSSVPLIKERLDQLVRDSGERSRPVIWRGAWQIFRAQPALGGGAGSFNVLFEKYRPENFQDEPQWAHNDYLDTLSDYGVVGFALSFGVCALIAARSLRGAANARSSGGLGSGLDNRRFRQALAIGLLAFALQLFVDFHFKIPALGMTFAVIAAILVQRSWVESKPAGIMSGGRRRACGAAGAAIAVLIVLFVLPHYRAEAARYMARREIDKLATEPLAPAAEQKLFLQGREHFAHATTIDPSNGQAWSDLAYATELWSIQQSDRRADLGREAEGYARRALVCSKILPEFWLRLGVALDMEGHWVDAGDAFMEALRLAPANSAAWFYQGYHLSLIPSMRALAVSAIATSLRLDPGRREAEALRQRLAASH